MFLRGECEMRKSVEVERSELSERAFCVADCWDRESGRAGERESSSPGPNFAIADF
jgi:hypothetical protein